MLKHLDLIFTNAGIQKCKTFFLPDINIELNICDK